MALATSHAALVRGLVQRKDPKNMKILVLGSAGRAACLQCEPGASAARPLAQRSAGAAAVAGAEGRWLLLNCSADTLRHPQIESAMSAGAIAGVVLLDAQFEHAASLLALGRAQPLHLYATPGVFEALTQRLLPPGLLDGGCAVRWHLLPVAGDVRSSEFCVEGLESLRLIAVDDGGWAAPHAPNRRDAAVGDSIALLVEDRLAGQRLVYSPGAPGDAALPWMEGADCLLVNGSVCPLHAGHEPIDTPWAALGARRTVLIHLNDCDPRLQDGSEARRAAHAAGIELAYDGMEIEL
jgi:pyrroloquinoline quinone biosynthesis protein B